MSKDRVTDTPMGKVFFTRPREPGEKEDPQTTFARIALDLSESGPRAVRVCMLYGMYYAHAEGCPICTFDHACPVGRDLLLGHKEAWEKWCKSIRADKRASEGEAT